MGEAHAHQPCHVVAVQVVVLDADDLYWTGHRNACEAASLGKAKAQEGNGRVKSGYQQCVGSDRIAQPAARQVKRVSQFGIAMQPTAAQHARRQNIAGPRNITSTPDKPRPWQLILWLAHL